MGLDAYTVWTEAPLEAAFRLYARRPSTGVHVFAKWRQHRKMHDLMLRAGKRLYGIEPSNVNDGAPLRVDGEIVRLIYHANRRWPDYNRVTPEWLVETTQHLRDGKHVYYIASV